MKNKKITYAAAAAIVVLGFLINNLLSSQKETLQRRQPQTQNKKIKTIIIENKDRNKKIQTSGRLTALNKIEVYAEVSGLLEQSSMKFKEGTAFAKNQALVHIDDEVYRNNLLAQKSSLLNQLTLLLPDLKIDFPDGWQKWEAYLSDFDLDKNMKPLPKPQTDQEKYYIASRNIYNLFYSVKSMEATLDKYTIRAPYSGVVTESNINPGTLVRAGQKLGEFTNTSVFELEAAVGISDIDYIKSGSEVLLTSNDTKGEFTGKIVRINKSIDQSTQTFKAFIQTTDQRLKDGMFLTAGINVNGLQDIAVIPRSVLVGRDQVYIIADSKLKLKSVEIIENENDSVLVRGLAGGTKILGETIPSAYDGMELNGTTNN